MAVDPILGWTLIAESEDEPYVRANEIGERITKATQQDINIDCTAGGTIVVTAVQFEENVHLELSGTPGAGFTLEVPDGDRQYVVENGTGQAATVDTVTGAASPINVPGSSTVHIQNKGVNLVKTADVGAATGALQADGSIVVTGDFDWADKIIKKSDLKDTSEVTTAPTTSSGVLTLNIENGNVFEPILTENVTTLNLDNPSPIGKTCTITIKIIQDGTGGWTWAWPASVVWASAIAPTLSLGANDEDLIVLSTSNAGTKWFGALVGLDFG